MNSEDAGRVAAAIAAYDGKGIDSLAPVAAGIAPSPAVLQALCDFVGSEDARVQSAASWLLRRYAGAGAILSQMQTEQALAVLTIASHWEARLHVLQMMGDLILPSKRVEQLWLALIEQSKDVNKFIRAWSYHGLAVIADQHPPYRGRALSLLAAAEGEEAASVRARIRRIRVTFKWAG
ncbi:MAG: hypothetical protein OXT68_17960 [Chloroflexota bacterium]|nr:hypothetical protein [Chloroflexota bacterium]